MNNVVFGNSAPVYRLTPVCCSGAGLGSAEAATPVDYSAGAACYDWQAADYQEYKV